MTLEEVKPGQKYPTDHVRVERVDPGHLRIQNLFAGPVSVPTGKKLQSDPDWLAIRDKYQLWMGTPILVTNEEWMNLKGTRFAPKETGEFGRVQLKLGNGPEVFIVRTTKWE